MVKTERNHLGCGLNLHGKFVLKAPNQESNKENPQQNSIINPKRKEGGKKTHRKTQFYARKIV